MAARRGFEFLLVFSFYYVSLTVTAETVTYQVLNSPSISDFINIRYKRQALTNISTTQSAPAITTTRPTTSPSTKSTTQGLGLPGGVTLPGGTDVIFDSHIYYTSTVIQKKIINYWIDLPSFGNHVRHKHLSNNHRVAVTLTLPFSFVFYGHQVKKVTVATGGFLYLSDFIHQWLVATQYVAPLMANFDTTLGDSSEVYYLMEANRLIVQWQQVYVKEHPKYPFTFQVHLLQDGTIYFVYKQVGLPLTKISTKNHPVKVGTSDAYYQDQMIGNVRRRTIYEYHRIRISQEQIKSDTVILLRPLPTCVSYTNCLGCLEAKIGFECGWCSAVDRCSDGLDRHRQSWQNNKCSEELTGPICPSVKTTHTPVTRPNSNAGDTAGVVLGLLAALLVIGGLVGFVIYAYKNPTSRPGQWLIKHRPSNWKFKFSRDQGTGDKYRVGGESTA